MLCMDKHLINHPTEGVNSMVYWLTALGFIMGIKRIRRFLSDGQTDPVSKEKSNQKQDYGNTFGRVYFKT